MKLDLRDRTALVTGASAGIGKELARVLAREVGTLVLVARRLPRLDELADELRRNRPELRVVTRSVDLIDRAAAGAALDALAAEGVLVDVLINNAGSGDYGLFEKSEWPKIEAMLELNVLAPTFLLRRLLPGMVARGFGAVLNVGSIAGMVPNPGTTAYGATKAYFNHLSAALRAELDGTGVHVTTLCPGPVRTEFQAVAGLERRDPYPELIHVSAEACAEQAIRALEQGRAEIVPGALGYLPIEAAPRALMRAVSARVGRRLRRREG